MNHAVSSFGWCAECIKIRRFRYMGSLPLQGRCEYGSYSGMSKKGDYVPFAECSYSWLRPR